MLIDLHTHTQPLSHDSSLTADELVEVAKEAGLDGLCLTEHDFFWDHDEVRRLARRHRFVVIPGIEVNTEDGHFLVFGLERYVYGMHRTRDLVSLVTAAGGAIVAAHPYRRQLPWELLRGDDPRGGPAWLAALEQAVNNPAYRHVVAIEAHNGRGSERENAFAREVCQRLGLPATAGSDAHDRGDVARCATEFEAPVRDLDDLIEALGSGRFRPAILRP
jgi:hypothetical protein